MRLIQFLLFRNKTTSVLALRKYGKQDNVQPKETSVLAYRKYGVNADKSNNDQVLKK